MPNSHNLVSHLIKTLRKLQQQQQQKKKRLLMETNYLKKTLKMNNKTVIHSQTNFFN